MRAPPRKRWLATFLLLLAGAAGAAERWTVDPKASRAEFSVRFLGMVRINGRFERFEAAIEPAGEAKLRVRARFETASLRMATDAQERWTRGEEFFDAAHHPEIAFESAPFDRALLESGGGVDGLLSLRGTTRPTRLTLKTVECRLDDGAPCVLDASATVLRSAFGMRTRRGMIADRVALNLHIVARAADDAP